MLMNNSKMVTSAIVMMLGAFIKFVRSTDLPEGGRNGHNWVWGLEVFGRLKLKMYSLYFFILINIHACV